MDQIINALKILDASKDTHWTKDGKPSLEMIRAISKDPSVTREKLDKDYPNWTRANVQNGAVDKVAEDAKASEKPASDAATQAGTEPLPKAVDNVVIDHEAAAQAALQAIQIPPVELEDRDDPSNDEKIAMLDKALEDLNSEKDFIQRSIDEVNAERDKLIRIREAADRERPSEKAQTSIAASLRTSLEQREAAFNRRKQLIDGGVNQQVIDAVVKPLNAVDARVPRRR